MRVESVTALICKLTVSEEVPLKLAPEVLSSFAGEYRAPRGSFRVDVVDGALRLVGEGTPPVVIEHVGEARFRGYVEGLLEVYFAFDLDEEGIAQGGAGHFRIQGRRPRTDPVRCFFVHCTIRPEDLPLLRALLTPEQWAENGFRFHI